MDNVDKENCSRKLCYCQTEFCLLLQRLLYVGCSFHKKYKRYGRKRETKITQQWKRFCFCTIYICLF